MATIGILLALIDARKTGKGQFIDISMLDGTISWMQAILPEYLTMNKELPRGEHLLNGGRACYQIYETKDSRFLSVGALEFKFWEEFCRVIDKKELIPYHEAPDEEQMKMINEIQASIEEKTLQEWEQLFEHVDACVSPILTLEEMLDHPQIKHRQMIEEVYHPQAGVMRQIANPIKLSRAKVKTFRQAPSLGENNEEIIYELKK